ncbi:hypothetical protein [Anatilimnocola floriformis]|uniref:hypothetical protein n=1 Tax=Anatilimnocola floriformis TaxID=2948575 RepID=UPI0020C328A0|nr:hypothetical protein [Anatilimnocola floriformis]
MTNLRFNLLQTMRNLWSPAAIAAADLDDIPMTTDDPTNSAPHPGERIARYSTLIELKQLLQSFPEPARTTVVLVLDSQMSVHLPTLLVRDTFAFRLILTSSSGYLLSTLSSVDLSLAARAWGWSSVAYERGLPQALAAARESTAADEQLLVLAPSWLGLSI